MQNRFPKIELRASGKTIKGKIPYNSRSEDLGGFIEVLSPGCFSETLRNKSKILAFWNHDTSKPLASTGNGTLKLNDTRSGLNFEIRPPDNTWGKDVLTSVKRGDIDSCSFGFNCLSDEWTTQNGENLRTIESAELFEISPCSMPAYPDASVRNNSKDNGSLKDMDKKVLVEKRNKIWGSMQKMIDKGLDDTDREQYEKYEKEFDDLSMQLRHNERSDFMNTPATRAVKPGMEGDNSGDYAGDEAEVRIFEPGTYTAKKWDNVPQAEVRALNSYLAGETRDLQMDVDTKGGFAVASEVFMTEVIADKMDKVFVRGLSTIVQCKNAGSLGSAKLANDPASATWGAELSIGDEDADMDFEKRQLHPHPMSGYLLVSRTLVRNNPNISGFIRGRLAYKFAVPEEQAFLTGTGVNQPLGVMTESDAGINSDRDVSGVNTTTAIKADTLIDVVHNQKAQYRKDGSWIWHRDAVKRIRKLKDGEGSYIWQPGLAQGAPDVLLGYPVYESEYMNNTFTSGLLVGIFGDFGQYWIADSLNFDLVIAQERWIDTNQLGFVARLETDGMPIDMLAFSRVKMGS